MNEELSKLSQRRDELCSVFRSRRQCGGKVADCEYSTKVVKVPNSYRIDLYGRWTFCKFCDRCQRKSPGFKATEEQKAVAVDFDPAMVESVREARKVEAEEYSSIMTRIFELEKEDRDNDFWTRYHAHIASEEWKDKRRAVIRRCKNTCEGCGESQVEHVHHLSYDHLGDELLFELVGLCLSCHSKCHPERFNNQEVEF